jgi:hypothetical protein
VRSLDRAGMLPRPARLVAGGGFPPAASIREEDLVRASAGAMPSAAHRPRATSPTPPEDARGFEPPRDGRNRPERFSRDPSLLVKPLLVEVLRTTRDSRRMVGRPRRACAAGRPGVARRGHAVAVIDLHAIGFDPVFRRRDANQFMHPALPDEMIRGPALRQAILDRAGGPLRRRVAARWMRTRTSREIVRALGTRIPRDVRRHQEAVAGAPRAWSSSRRCPGWACRRS